MRINLALRTTGGSGCGLIGSTNVHMHIENGVIHGNLYVNVLYQLPYVYMQTLQAGDCNHA